MLICNDMAENTLQTRTEKCLVGEYPINTLSGSAGLFDYHSLDLQNGPDRLATNMDVLQFLAWLGGGSVYLTNPMTDESKCFNSMLTRGGLNKHFGHDISLRAVIFEKPVS